VHFLDFVVYWDKIWLMLLKILREDLFLLNAFVLLLEM
jgi:hypothetical protein